MVFGLIGKVLRYLFWISIVLSLIFTLIFLFGAKPIGVLQARYDLWRGRYEIQGYGLLFGEPPWIHILYLYGIDYRHVAGCMVNDFIIDKVSVYNETMKIAIKRDLGVDVDKLLGWSKNGSDAKPEAPLVLMETIKPWDLDNNVYTIGDCFQTLNVDVDGDEIKEKICLRYLQYKEYDDVYTYVSLVLDMFKEKKQVLRQELDRGFFFEERFVSLKDIDSDGKTELITRVRFSPDCSGCSSYRIYAFNEDRFELALNLFNIKPDNSSLKNVLGKLLGFEEMILNEYRKRTNTEHPCNLYEGCQRSDPWMVDSDRDGQPEVVFLVRTPEDTDSDTDKYYNLFLAKFTKSGKLAGYNLHKIDLECCDAFVDVLGFLEAQDKHNHLLINFAYPGTSTGYPVLNIFDVQPTNIHKVGAFAGFYEHVIAERLRDLDEDGNTEIIYVGESYLPPGAAHADVIIFYDIAEYRDGRYVEANEKFISTRDRLNNQ